jgi:hypothetical protein
MTTVFLSDKKCFVCERKNRYPQAGSSVMIIGTKDLDGRPSQMQRSAIYMWIQRCIYCGYCAVDISNGNENDRNLVESQEYKSQLTDKTYPETANAYLCRAMLSEKISKYSDAGWAAVYAAWVCDDNDYNAAAATCRGRALSLFQKAREAGQPFGETREEENLLLIDLMRRRGEFATARVLCEKELEESHNDTILDSLYFEQELIGRGDKASHCSEEAIEDDD